MTNSIRNVKYTTTMMRLTKKTEKAGMKVSKKVVTSSSKVERRTKDIICGGVCLALAIVVAVAIVGALAHGVRTHYQLYPAQRENVKLFLDQSIEVYELKLSMCSYAKIQDENMRRKLTTFGINQAILTSSTPAPTDIQPKNCTKTATAVEKRQCMENIRRTQIKNEDVSKLLDDLYGDDGLKKDLQEYCDFSSGKYAVVKTMEEEQMKAVNKIITDVNKQKHWRSTLAEKLVVSFKLVNSFFGFFTGLSLEDATTEDANDTESFGEYNNDTKIGQKVAMAAQIIFDLKAIFKDGKGQLQTEKEYDAWKIIKSAVKLLGVIAVAFMATASLVPKEWGNAVPAAQIFNLSHKVIAILTALYDFLKTRKENKEKTPSIEMDWKETAIFLLSQVSPIFAIIKMSCILANLSSSIKGHIEIIGQSIAIAVDHILLSLQVSMVLQKRDKMTVAFAEIRNTLNIDKCNMEQDEFNFLSNFEFNQDEANLTQDTIKYSEIITKSIGKLCKDSPRTCMIIYSNPDIKSFTKTQPLFSPEFFEKLHLHNRSNGPITDFAPSTSYFNDEELIGFGFKVTKRLNAINMNNLMYIRNGKFNTIIRYICIEYLDFSGKPQDPKNPLEIESMESSMPSNNLSANSKTEGCEFFIKEMKQQIDKDNDSNVNGYNADATIKRIRINYFANLIYITEDIKEFKPDTNYRWLHKIKIGKKHDVAIKNQKKFWSSDNMGETKKYVEILELKLTFNEQSAEKENDVIIWKNLANQKSKLTELEITKFYSVDKDKYKAENSNMTYKYCRDNCVNNSPLLNSNSCIRLYASKDNFDKTETIKKNCSECKQVINKDMNNYLETYDVLFPGEKITSNNGKYSFMFLTDKKTVVIIDNDFDQGTTDANKLKTPYLLYSKTLDTKTLKAKNACGALIFSPTYRKGENWTTLYCVEIESLFTESYNRLKKDVLKRRAFVKEKMESMGERNDLGGVYILSKHVFFENFKVDNKDNSEENKDLPSYLIISDIGKLEATNKRFQHAWSLDQQNDKVSKDYKTNTNKMHYLATGDYIDSTFAKQEGLSLLSTDNKYWISFNSEETEKKTTTTELRFYHDNWKMNWYRKIALVDNSPLRLAIDYTGLLKCRSYNNKLINIKYKSKGGKINTVQMNDYVHEKSRLIVTTEGILALVWYDGKSGVLQTQPIVKYSDIENNVDNESIRTDILTKKSTAAKKVINKN